MIAIYRTFRVYITRTFLMLLGLRVGYWRKEVERLWSLNPDERRAELNQVFSGGNHKASDGTAVRTLEDLAPLPFMFKKDLRENPVQPSSESAFHRDTAGTTGEPTHVRLNRHELGRMLGVRDYCYKQCGICVGEREGRLWAREGSGVKNRIRTILLNRRVFHPTGANRDLVVEELVKWKPAYLYGYSSLLLECARIVEEREWSITNLKCVICTAENIIPSQKQYLERVFGCPVFEEYGSTEFDIIAFECSKRERHIANPWLNIGTTYEGILYVTDVSRTSQSFIKYLIGDAAQLSVSSCHLLGSDVILKEILGRSQNRLAYVDPQLSFHAVEFAHAIDTYQKINNVSFTFTVYQQRYGEFMLEVEPSHQVQFQSVKEFTEGYIKDTTGFRVIVFQCQDSGNVIKDTSKRSYFIQYLEDRHG